MAWEQINFNCYSKSTFLKNYANGSAVVGRILFLLKLFTACVFTLERVGFSWTVKLLIYLLLQCRVLFQPAMHVPCNLCIEIRKEIISTVANNPHVIIFSKPYSPEGTQINNNNVPHPGLRLQRISTTPHSQHTQRNFVVCTFELILLQKYGFALSWKV